MFIILFVWKRPKINKEESRVGPLLKKYSIFSLPPSSIPVWADKMPDEQWNRLIRDRLGTEAQSKSEKQENPERDVSDQVLTTDWNVNDQSGQSGKTLSENLK